MSIVATFFFKYGQLYVNHHLNYCFWCLYYLKLVCFGQEVLWNYQSRHISPERMIIISTLLHCWSVLNVFNVYNFTFSFQFISTLGSFSIAYVPFSPLGGFHANINTFLVYIMQKWSLELFTASIYMLGNWTLLVRQMLPSSLFSKGVNI